MPQDPSTLSKKGASRPLDKALLGAWLATPGHAKSFRLIFTKRTTKHFKDIAKHPTHFNDLHYMTMRELLLRTDCGPSDSEVRELLNFLAEFGVIGFKDDIISIPVES